MNVLYIALLRDELILNQAMLTYRQSGRIQVDLINSGISKTIFQRTDFEVGSNRISIGTGKGISDSKVS